MLQPSRTAQSRRLHLERMADQGRIFMVHAAPNREASPGLWLALCALGTVSRDSTVVVRVVHRSFRNGTGSVWRDSYSLRLLMETGRTPPRARAGRNTSK